MAARISISVPPSSPPPPALHHDNVSTAAATTTASTKSEGGQQTAGSLDLIDKAPAPPTASTPTKPPPGPARRSTTFLSRTPTSRDGNKETDKSPTKAPSPQTTGAHALDPLSNQIFLRQNSNTEPSIAQRFFNPTGRPDSPNPEVSRQQSIDSNPPQTVHPADVSRRKGPSFLSRLSIRAPFKKDDDMLDSDSELGELRMDGSQARALTSVMGAGGGYIPLHKKPPQYIRVRPHNKKQRNFNRLFLAQELQGSRLTPNDTSGRAPATAVGTKLLKGDGAAIWASEFSLDGKYLAVAGKDQIIRIFAVISTREERQQQDEDEAMSGTGGEKLSAPVFMTRPVREFEGHTGDVLSLSWSKNNFLLSSSMDKTVRLWHMSMPTCLATFPHDDLVTSIAFHPTDDRFFLAGSLDSKLRLWSIPEKDVAFSAPTTEFITAVAFSPDGKVAICGLLTGLCNFYDTQELKLKFQIHVRSSRGKNAKGSKITGIRTITVSNDKGEDLDTRVLITSNDSRLRIYSLKDRMLEVKLKGLENSCSQIHARFSSDGKNIVCGSEDRRAYIWALSDTDVELKDKQPYECFDAHPEVVTTAVMAPMKAKQLLSASEDPIYDLCNPPPVELVSLDEQISAAQSVVSETDKLSIPGTPSMPATPSRKTKPEESPAYIERTKHTEGNIIITTDRTGTIKVFRQDCAFAKRQQSWETGSRFSGKLVGRSGSVATRNSAGSRVQSRRGSLVLGQPVLPVQQASDRIMSWRQDIEGGSNRNSINRSPSPAKLRNRNSSAATLASDARRQPYMSPTLRSSKATSPASSLLAPKGSRRSMDTTGPTMPPTPSFSLISASDSDREEKEKGDSFWNLSIPRWRGLSGLRYSTSSSAVGTVPPEGVGLGVNEDPNGTGSSNGAGSNSNRKSFAAGDLKKLRDEARHTRKKSAVLVEPLQEEVEKQKKDSGLGELSDEGARTMA